MNLLGDKIDFEGIKAWWRKLRKSHRQTTIEKVDWLIAEVERLTDEVLTREECIGKVRHHLLDGKALEVK